MKIPTLGAIVFASVLAAGPAHCEPAEPAVIDGSAFVFTYFVGNGEDGLHLLVSRDGLKWHPVNGGKSVFNAQVGSQRLMRRSVRDPRARWPLPSGLDHRLERPGHRLRPFARPDPLVHAPSVVRHGARAPSRKLLGSRSVL